jgi:hypothetical protein
MFQDMLAMSNNGESGINLDVSVVDKYMKNGTYTRTLEIDPTKDYLIYSYMYTSDAATVAAYKLYSLYKGVLTVEETTTATAPAATMTSETTLQMKFGSSYWNGYVVIQLD